MARHSAVRALMILAIVLIPSGVHAETPRKVMKVTFSVWPAATHVWIRDSSSPEYDAGPVARPVNVRFPLLQARLTGKVRFTLRLDGFASRELELSAEEFKDGHYPRSGTESMVADSPLVQVKWLLLSYPVISLAIGFVLLGLAAVLLRGHRKARKAIERFDAITELQESATGIDSGVIGKVFGSYRLVKKIGSGGMATVYRADPRDAILSKPESGTANAVAIKLMHDDMASNKDFLERFRHEVQICQKLRHPSIVGLVEWGEETGMLYMTMELVDGVMLRKKMETGPLPLPMTMIYLRPILDAVAYAHEHGVVHRDLKPENIMVTQKGGVKVMDFGLAKSKELSNLTKTGTALGTPAYMAPEQISGGPWDPRSDQYALGIIAYEMLAGRPAFEAEDPIMILMKHYSEMPTSLVEEHPEIPTEVEAVIFRMLAKTPDERFETLREAQDALEHAAQGALGGRRTGP